MDRWIDGHMDRCLDSYKNGWRVGQMDRWVSGWEDGWVDGFISSTFTTSLASRHGHAVESCQLNVFKSAKLPALMHVVLKRIH